jgi:hypothetical protein
VDQLPWDQLGIGSGWALVALFAWLIYTGRLIPKSTHDREMAQAAATLSRSEHDANEWRAEGRIKDQAIITTLDHVDAKVESLGKGLHDFIAALQRVRLPNSEDQP